jgi:Peptidase S46
MLDAGATPVGRKACLGDELPRSTLNSKGELVGLLFDGTDESVASNVLFDR